MRLKNENVKLRATEPKDVDVIFEWENDTENWLVSDTVVPYSRYQILQFIEQGSDIYAQHQCRFMIEDKNETPIGCVDLYEFDAKNHRVGLGILIDKDFREKGLGAEALALAVEYCFNMLEVHSIFAYILKNNERSIRMFEGLNFQHNGTRKEWLWNGSEFCDERFYQIVRGKDLE